MPASRPCPHRRVLALTAACAGALALAACGGDDDPATTSPTTTAAATTSTESTGTTSTTEPTTTTSDATDVDALRDQFNQQLRQVLTGEQGLTEDQADCAIDELQDSLTDDALRQVAETGKPPEGVIDAAFDAGAKCKEE